MSENVAGLDFGNDGEAVVEWTNVPTLQNSWVQLANYSTAQYSRDGQGVVHLKGVIDAGTETAATLLFTLPTGFRPADKEVFNAACFVFDGTTATALPVIIDVDGTVKVGPTAVATDSSISLSGITFVASGN